jgi:cation transport ATPase
MSEAPSWLTEENISTASKVTQNPAAQKAAKNIAKNPEVQKAVKKEVIKAASSPTAADNAPQWANNTETYVPPGGDVETGRTPSTSNNATSDFVIEEETLKQMQRWHIALRVLYMIASILMCAAAVLSFTQSNANIGVAFFAMYTVFFSTMICCFECALEAVARLIAVNFGFMYTLFGRAVFLLFVGFMSFQLSLFGQIAMGILYAVGLFHMYVMYRFPRFEEYLRKKHYFEGKRAANAAGRA